MTTSHTRRLSGGLRLAALVVVVTASGSVAAQQDDVGGPRGTMSLSYQYNEARNMVGDAVTYPTNTVYTRLADFAVDYALSDRWSVSAGLPLVSRKNLDPYRLHDPLHILPPHPESEFIDDGQFHTYWQDLRLGGRYLAMTDPFIVEPYIELSIPMSDYPFFANSAPGQHLRRLEYGTTLAYRPPFLQWYFHLLAGYANLPSTLGVSIDGTRVDGQATRFLNQQVSLRVFFSSKHSKGWPVPITLPPFTSELWYDHDRMFRHNFINVGIGTDIAWKNSNTLSIDWIRMPHAQDVFQSRKGLNVTLSRSFGSPVASKHPGRARTPSVSN